MPSGAIEQQDGVVRLQLHCVRSRRGEAEIGVVVSLVGGLCGARSAPGPLADEAVLLADPGSHPELVERRPGTRSRPASSRADLRDEHLGALEIFLNASTIRSSCAGWRGLALMWEKPIFFRSVPT